MRILNFEDSFNIDVDLFWKLCILDPKFESSFHSSQGDLKVDISQWIDLPGGAFQRACFYTMVEGDKVEDGTKCMETQNFVEISDNKSFNMTCTIVPENPVGNIFSIQSFWQVTEPTDKKGRNKSYSNLYDAENITQNTPKTTKVIITVKVECARKIWMLSVVENILEKQAKIFYTNWIKCAHATIKQYNASLSPENLLGSTDSIIRISSDDVVTRSRSSSNASDSSDSETNIITVGTDKKSIVKILPFVQISVIKHYLESIGEKSEEHLVMRPVMQRRRSRDYTAENVNPVTSTPPMPHLLRNATKPNPINLDPEEPQTNNSNNRYDDDKYNKVSVDILTDNSRGLTLRQKLNKIHIQIKHYYPTLGLMLVLFTFYLMMLPETAKAGFYVLLFLYYIGVYGVYLYLFHNNK